MAASAAATPTSITSAPTALTTANGKGEIINREHTPSSGERPLFGGHEVSIGFSGAPTVKAPRKAHRARRQAQHVRFKAVRQKLVEA